jgi:hypothetical protein
MDSDDGSKRCSYFVSFELQRVYDTHLAANSYLVSYLEIREEHCTSSYNPTSLRPDVVNWHMNIVFQFIHEGAFRFPR